MTGRKKVDMYLSCSGKGGLGPYRGRGGSLLSTGRKYILREWKIKEENLPVEI